MGRAASVFFADASSAGTMTLSGSADSLDAGASSGGIIESYSLTAREVTATASSAGIVQACAEGKLTARASSAGKVQYKGSPVNIDKDESSAGTVQRIGWGDCGPMRSYWGAFL